MTPLDTPRVQAAAGSKPDNDCRWSLEGVLGVFELPFSDLIHRAQSVHRQHFDPNSVQLSTLLSIKTGGCFEDCCPQSVRYQPGYSLRDLLPLDDVVDAARRAGMQRHAFLHRCGLARAQGQRAGARARWCVQ
jgi:biotin synthase